MEIVMRIRKILSGVVIVTAVFFVLTFIIYFFNLDMKAAAKIMPVISKQYDKIKKRKKLITKQSDWIEMRE